MTPHSTFVDTSVTDRRITAMIGELFIEDDSFDLHGAMAGCCAVMSYYASLTPDHMAAVRKLIDIITVGVTENTTQADMLGCIRPMRIDRTLLIEAAKKIMPQVQNYVHSHTFLTPGTVAILMEERDKNGFKLAAESIATYLSSLAGNIRPYMPPPVYFMTVIDLMAKHQMMALPNKDCSPQPR